ncbi:hypothetical protein C8Q79DRAFT_761324 [Trametes meyenii]|nr:hypothetical protein C8Q79DRAFT_761324 [Trametes meyenii]
MSWTGENAPGYYCCTFDLRNRFGTGDPSPKIISSAQRFPLPFSILSLNMKVSTVSGLHIKPYTPRDGPLYDVRKVRGRDLPRRQLLDLHHILLLIRRARPFLERSPRPVQEPRVVLELREVAFKGESQLLHLTRAHLEARGALLDVIDEHAELADLGFCPLVAVCEGCDLLEDAADLAHRTGEDPGREGRARDLVPRRFCRC